MANEKFDAYPMVTFVNTSDPKKAKAFYGDKLGLQFVEEDGFAVVFKGHGTTLRVGIAKEVTPVKYTVLGWEVYDIRQAVELLKELGITMERFPGLEQDDLAVWHVPGVAAKVAWFKDPDGNLLSVSQH